MGRFGGKGDQSRLLMPGEVKLIRQVFQHARLPSLMMTVTIANGVNGNGGAWTDSDYEINVGPDLFEQDLSTADPSTLIHEMTHVWQYFNGTLTKAHAAAAQALYGFARRSEYLYDYDLGESWNDMGFEGQAQLVEKHRLDFAEPAGQLRIVRQVVEPQSRQGAPQRGRIEISERHRRVIKEYRRHGAVE